MKNLYRIMAVLLVALFTVSAVGCNTIRGMGQDVEEGGENIQDAATP